MSCCPEELHETCSVLQSYWIVLATEENALLALLPTKRTVPTTSTKITASITAYSAMSSRRHRAHGSPPGMLANESSRRRRIALTPSLA